MPQKESDGNELLGCLGCLVFIIIALALCIVIKWLWLALWN